VDRSVEGDLLGLWGAWVQRAGIEELHRPALAVKQIAVDAMPAQRLDVGVDLVEAGRGQ
jgi:hypothetical protein